MSQYTMTIDGQPVSSPRTLTVINPATGEVFAEVPDCTREQLDAAMQSAQRAFGGWKDDYEKRRAVMYACADALEADAERLGRLAGWPPWSRACRWRRASRGWSGRPGTSATTPTSTFPA
jgi:delta 1-pyrroline-5-carboxylate dehydrogenase